MVYSLGEVLITKKKHPCGCDEWTVVRTGADYKIKCNKCGRIVLLSADALQKAVKRKGGGDGGRSTV